MNEAQRENRIYLNLINTLKEEITNLQIKISTLQVEIEELRESKSNDK